jgi:hypothetical protein
MLPALLAQSQPVACGAAPVGEGEGAVPRLMCIPPHFDSGLDRSWRPTIQCAPLVRNCPFRKRPDGALDPDGSTGIP